MADLEAWLKKTRLDLAGYLAQVAPLAAGSPSTCTDLANDVDALYSRLIQEAQAAYNGLKSAAVTEQEQKAVDTSEKNTDLAGWRAERDKAIAAILKLCP